MKGPWVKLWRSFLSDPTIQYLKKRHGDVTVTLLVALLTATCDGIVESPEDELAVLCDLSDEKFAELVKIIGEKGIIGRTEEGKIYFKNWNKYQESDSTERTRVWREKQKNTDNDVVSQERHGDGSRDEKVTPRSKKLEVRIKKEYKKDSPSKKTYGEFKNVLLLDTDLSSLRETYGPAATDAMIAKLSSYKSAKGKTYKNDIAAIRQWVIEAVGAVPIPPPPPTCPICGHEISDGICPNAECPQYADDYEATA